MKTFSIQEMLKEGWLTTKTHLGFFITLVAIVILGIGVPLSISEAIFQKHPLAGGLVYLLYLILSMTFTLGLIRIALRFADQRTVTLRDLFRCFPYIGRFFFGQLLYFLILLAGLILLIFPMFIWGVRYSFFAYFIVDGHMRPINALKASAKLTDGFKWKLFGYFVIATLLNIAGAIPFGLGLFVTIPITMIAQALLFRTLQGKRPVTL